MKNKNKNKIIIFLIISLFFMLGSGLSTWVISKNNEAIPEYNPISGLTNHLKSATASQYIYDPETNENFAEGSKETVNSSITYSAISSDVAYIGEDKTIYLGDPNNVLTLQTDVTFTHKNSVVDYSESNYLNSTNFTPADGSTDTWYSYKSSNSATTNTTLNKYSQWINYYYTPHTYTYTDYTNSTSGEKKTTVVPSQRLFTVKLCGDIIVNSILSIGALISANSNGYAGGIIEGNFMVLDLNGHTITINSGATLNAYGYIIDTKLDENGKHIGQIINNGTIYSSFVVENYSGGGNTVATGAYGTAPFTLFSVPYLSCKVVFNYGSSLKCPTSLYASDSFSKIVVNLIGDSSDAPLIEMSSGSQVIKDSYNNPVELNTTALYAKNYKSYFNLSGNINIKTLKINLKVVIEKTINMAEFGMTIPPYMHINVENGTVSLGMRLDFLPGSTLTVQENATVDLTTLTLPADETIKGSQIVTDGSVRMVSQMTADGSLCYKGTSYGVGVTTGYSNYLANEATINQAGNTDARANIYGNITVSSTSSKHYLVGKINLFNNSLSQVSSNSNISTYSKSYEFYAYISGTDLGLAVLGGANASAIQNRSSNQVCSSYVSLPLVSQGKVVNPSNISSYLGDNTTYDYTYGVFTYNSKTYAFIPDNTTATDLNMTLREVSFDSSIHSIIYNNEVYVYYRNMYTKSNKTVDGKLYLYDSYYSNFATKSYYAIDTNNNKVNYTFKYTGVGTIDTASFTASRTRESPFLSTSWNSWSVSDTDWNAGNVTWSDASNVTTGTTESSTTNYKLELVNIVKYTFSSHFVDVSSFDYKVSTYITNRPINASKFSQSTTTYKYYQVGTANMNYSLSESSEVTDWMKDMSTKSVVTTGDTSTSRWSKQTQTQTMTVSGTRNHNTISAQTWTLNNQKMYVYINSTCLKWNDTIKQWVKG